MYDVCVKVSRLPDVRVSLAILQNYSFHWQVAVKSAVHNEVLYLEVSFTAGIPYRQLGLVVGGATRKRTHLAVIP